MTSTVEKPNNRQKKCGLGEVETPYSQSLCSTLISRLWCLLNSLAVFDAVRRESPGLEQFFRLERFEQDGVFDSLEELVAQGEKELSPICVMPGYRANGPYSETMAAYATMYPYFSRHLNPMVVLLDDVKYSSTAHWTKNEQKVLDADLPLVRLKDYDHELTFALGQTVSPVVYVVQRNGKMVYQGQLDAPIDYWRLLQKNCDGKVTV